MLKDIDAAKFEEVNNVKLYILQIKFQRNVACYIDKKNYCSGLLLFFVVVVVVVFVFVLFFAFMRKFWMILVDSLALL